MTEELGIRVGDQVLVIADPKTKSVTYRKIGLERVLEQMNATDKS